MALGNNLKKKKLIEDQKEVKKKTPSAAKKKSDSALKKKKSNAPKKELIKKPGAYKAKSSSVVKKTSNKQKRQNQSPQLSDSIKGELPLYIAQQIQAQKEALRKRYEGEIAQLHGKLIQFVVFEVGGESYAIDIDTVKEVVAQLPISKTPNTPPHILGIANVRGSTYVVFDLATKFNIGQQEEMKYLMVVHTDRVAAALTLSSLPATYKISGDHISSDLSMIEDASLDISYIKGLIQYEDKLLYYLDVIELLKNDKAIVVPDKLAKTS